jgi:hypothetical protein
MDIGCRQMNTMIFFVGTSSGDQWCILRCVGLFAAIGQHSDANCVHCRCRSGLIRTIVTGDISDAEFRTYVLRQVHDPTIQLGMSELADFTPGRANERDCPDPA